MIPKSTHARAVISTLATTAFLLTSTAGLAAEPPAPAVVVVPAETPPVPRATLRIPEGTEIHVHLTERLSSAEAGSGDTFSIVSDENFRLPDGTVIPAGYSGRGEVTSAEKSGMLGKSGELRIKLDYLRIGDSHVQLRATKSSEGKGNTTALIASIALVGVFGFFVRGHNTIIPVGQPMLAYVDQDATVDLPVAPPPVAN